MNVFKIPKTDYTDHYDLARFSLSWRVSVLMAIILVLLGFLLMSLSQYVFYPTFVGAIAAFAFLVILKRTRCYEAVAVAFSIIGTFLCQFTLIFLIKEYHMSDVMWMLVITLYTFFMLGKVWGVIILTTNTLGIIVFVVFFLNSNLTLLGTLEEGQIFGLCFNFAVSSLLISFLIFEFLNVIQIAENDFRQINNELKNQNDTIAFQNQEKTVMLKEIHHRVKNNLQVITSLLRLQSGEIEDKKSKVKFDETIHRVVSMALIHERMYQSENLSKIDLEGYIESLSESLILSYNIQKPISLTVSCEMEEVHPKSLVSLALIFNELITNSLKHAFTNDKKPLIMIDLRFEGEDTVELYYSDNGVWKGHKERSFGMELIESLSDQLNGTFTIDTEDGTHFIFTFKKSGLLED